MTMRTKDLAIFLQKAVQKDRSPIADCTACVATPLGGWLGADAPHAADPEPGFLERIPWKWVVGTMAITIPATGFLTFKLTQSMAKSELGLKMFEKRVGAKRKRRKKAKRKRSRRR